MTFYAEDGEIGLLAGAFESFDAGLESVRQSLRNLDVADTGPREVGESFARVVERLEAELGAISTSAQEAAVVVRRYVDEAVDP